MIIFVPPARGGGMEITMEVYENYICKNCKREVENFDGNYRFCPYCGEDLVSKKDGMEVVINLDSAIEIEVYSWLSKMLQIDRWFVSDVIKNQMATVFLLIWPILENKVFNCDMSHNKILSVAVSVEHKIPDKDLEIIFLHFHKRYQDKEKYKKLQQDHEWKQIERILALSSTQVWKRNRIVFMIFVVYRYRNNIFHGIKNIMEWGDFSEEIQLCIRFMILLGNSIDLEDQCDGNNP